MSTIDPADRPRTTYAVCECLDDKAMKLQGPAIIFTQEELEAASAVIGRILMPGPWDQQFINKQLLLHTVAKLSVVLDRKKDL